ncbi:hypothetical protein O3G_MSEX012282 [Manduca sexta]|uniref:Jumonji domain-containing protein 4 n=1 Tax=Manduca sexta TaxID=7130 RepID=A0A921ZNC5_MANSE|nr:hypothetical protein O3G_MSEX012282 [Manduca sexta]KAG6460891.1 hypothetical protein O3G_MSEX012282 [Manduca sexta]
MNFNMNEIEIGCNVNGKSEQELLDGYIRWECDKYTVENLTYEDFYNNHLVTNLPCVIKNITSEWECTKKWIENNTINHNYFIENYGDLEAPVADCNNISYNAHCKTDMKVSDYMNYLRDSEKSKLLYLKDWHLKKLRPNDKFYDIPKIFASDWLNEYAQDNDQDDFMFVYIGPKYSWTPLHVDVYTSFSWSVNVIGKKKWILFPPGEENKLKDSLDNLPMIFDPDKTKNIKYFEVIQEQGDGIFVPSGWYHQVLNVEDTISINHNWVNACNIQIVCNSLAKNLTVSTA